MKKQIAFLLLFLCLLCGCGKEEIQKEALACVSAEDCLLCGRAEQAPWGQNNVGLISLNTFEMMSVRINGAEERIDVARMRSFQGGEDGFLVSGLEDPGRGYAMLTVALGQDAAIDWEKTAAFLCKDCLEDIEPEGAGLGAVNLATGEIGAFDRKTRGFGLGDFYIHCDWGEGGEKVELLVFYCPSRF